MPSPDKVAKDHGRALASEVLKKRADSVARRRSALRKLPAGKAKPPVPKPELAKAAGGKGSRGLLVAEGDSWFDYPWADVLAVLEDDYAYDVESVAHKGDRVEAMAYDPGQLESFVRIIDRNLRNDRIPKAILLSGGGNDIAGDEFAVLLDHVNSPASGLNGKVVDGVVNQRLRNSYITILSAITRVCEETIGKVIPIVTHGYGYAVPDGRGFMGGAWVLPGPWLEPGFRQKGYDGMKRRREIISDLIDRFNAMVKGVAGMQEFGHVRYVDLRKELTSGDGYKKDWANELHPTPGGFRKVTAVVARAIEA